MGESSKCLLLTGFGLWGEETVNTSWEVLRAVQPELPIGWSLVCEKIPVEWSRGPEALLEALTRPGRSIGAVVCFGMCGGDRVRPERLALNLNDRTRADARERRADSDFVNPSGPPAYWTGLEYPALMKTLVDAGIPCMASHDAGGFLCNAIFYTLMHARARARARFPAGFIHLPHGEAENGLPAEVLARAAAICIDHAIHLAVRTNPTIR